MTYRQLKQHIISRIGIIPYYHIVSDEEVLHVKHLYKYKTIRQFKEDIDFLLMNYTSMGLLDIMKYIKADRPLPKKAFLLTFDDGFREMHEIVAPILLEKGVQAAFFINSAFIDNRQMCYLNKASILAKQYGMNHTLRREEVARIMRINAIQFDDVISGILSIGYHKKQLLDDIAQKLNIDFDDYLSMHKPYLTSGQINHLIEKGFSIGAHSIDHPYYANLSLEAQLEQTITSVKHIRENFKLGYGAFAFPHNDTGVSREFFNRICESGVIDVTFGTGGMIDGCVSFHRQRVSLEKPLLPARILLERQYARRLYKQWVGKSKNI
jgi:peptidoglycan/xylan/chitin deacetylase (PgdA/CDA1 family)